MAIDIAALTQEVNKEVLGEKEALVKKLIQEELKTFQFNEQNLTQNLISLFMTKQDIKVPLPEKKDIPMELDDSASEMSGFINADVAAIYTDLMVGNNVYLFGKAGTGKAQPLTARVLGEKGWITFADIKVGDKVWGQDGKLYEVDGVFNRGLKPVYKVNLSDGGVAETCDEHLWKVQTRSQRNYKREGSVMELREFMNNLKIGKDANITNAYIPMPKAIPFPEQKHIVDPYLMGVLLGDGGLTNSGPNITNPSEELFENLVLPDGMELNRSNSDDRCLAYRIKSIQRTNDKSVLTKELDRVGLMGKNALEKFIPIEYLYDSIENRIALLQGLCDTDGYASETEFCYNTSSERLAIDFTELVRSLGGTAKTFTKVPSYTHNGEKKNGSLAYTVRCVFPENIIPHRLREKVAKYFPPTKYFPKRAIDSVEYKGLEEVRCISVTNPEHLYITDGYAVTHNTTLAKKVSNFLLQRETITINCNQFTSPINIIGGQTIEGYKQGKLVEAWEKGACLILDELPKLDPNTAGLLNEALAESAGVETEVLIKKEEYDSLKELQDAGADLGMEVKKDGDKYIKKIFVTITDGKGDKIRKHKNFCVIATGNTNMKEVSSNFSGNNRQDYSLVDRFTGSFYEIKYDTVLEKSLTYDVVYKVSVIIREELDSDSGSVESVSLRTMLNFNRIFEQEYLRKVGSKYAVAPIVIGGRPIAKTFRESVDSFVNTLPDGKRVAISKTQALDLAAADVDLDDFVKEFIRLHKVSPI